MCTSNLGSNASNPSPAPVATRPVIVPESAPLGTGIAGKGKTQISAYAKKRQAALSIGE